MPHRFETPLRVSSRERLLALSMLRDVLKSLVPSLPPKLGNEELVDFLLSTDTLEVIQESIARGRGRRHAIVQKPSEAEKDTLSV